MTPNREIQIEIERLQAKRARAAMLGVAGACESERRDSRLRVGYYDGQIGLCRRLLDLDNAPRRGTARTAQGGFRVRSAAITPASIDEENQSVEAVLATEDACYSIDLKTRKSYLEIYLMTGARFDSQVPLIDTHVRDSIDRVKGSVRDIRVEGNELIGRLFIDESEQAAWSKVSGKHVTDVSFGVEPLDTIAINPGETVEVLGTLRTAPKNQTLYVHTAWRLREVSLTPIGSDKRAKIRREVR